LIGCDEGLVVVGTTEGFEVAGALLGSEDFVVVGTAEGFEVTGFLLGCDEGLVVVDTA
jgi:hypothetical protein